METMKWPWIIMFLLLLSFMSYIIAGMFSFVLGGTYEEGNVAVIPINGVILLSDGPTYFTEQVMNAKDIIDAVKRADENEDIKAILLDINSPGGSAVASMEAADAVKRANKTVYAFIHEQGTSGAYWIASAADRIIANELALTGSIGVISSYLEFSGLLQDYNVTYQRLVAGKYKDIGTPFRKLTGEEEMLLQKRLDVIHDRFISSVAENRHMLKDKVKESASGLFYLGSEAKDLGFVDDIGDMEHVTTIIKNEMKLDKVNYVEYKRRRTVFDMLQALSNSFGFWTGRGISAPWISDLHVST